jgi:hypothetical protein
MVKTQNNPPAENDFKLNEIIEEKFDSHSKELAALSGRLKGIEDKFSTNDKIADVFKGVIERDALMQATLVVFFEKCLSSDSTKSILINLICQNSDIKDAISKRINDCDRDYVAKAISRFGGWIGALLIAIVSSIVTLIIKSRS